MGSKQGSAFITTKKGFCYLTVKIGRSNFNLMRIRKYTLEPEDKRDMRRLHPDYLFDWKKINKQLAEKREVCRDYRSRRRVPKSTERTADPFVMVSYDPSTRTVYASDASCPLALLDAVLDMDRTHKKEPRQAVTCGGWQAKGHLIGSQLLLTPSTHESNNGVHRH